MLVQMRIPAQGFPSYSRGSNQQEHPQWCSCYPFTPHSWHYPAQKTQAAMVPLPPSQLSLQPPPRQKCPGKRNSGAKLGEVNPFIWKESQFPQQKLPELFIPPNLQHLPCAAETKAQPGTSWADLDQYPQHLWLSIPKQEVLSPAGDTADPGGRTGVGLRRMQRALTVGGGAEGGTDTFLLPTPWSVSTLSFLTCLSSHFSFPFCQFPQPLHFLSSCPTAWTSEGPAPAPPWAGGSGGPCSPGH